MRPKNHGKSSPIAASDGLVCPICDSKSIDTFVHSDTFRYGSGDSAATLRVDKLPVRSCKTCDFEFIDHEGERLRHEAVCRHLGVLTPTEVLETRKSHGMTRAAFAEVTGLGEATLGRWETGALIQNRANDRYLRLVHHPFVMSILRGWSALGSEPKRNVVDSPRFRSVDKNDPSLRAREESFQLRIGAPAVAAA